jgi:hypothetical protein
MGSPTIFNGTRTKLLTANGLMLQSGAAIDYNGPKNYIGNGTFENGTTTGWSLSHTTLDSTTKTPNQASASWTSAAGTLSASAVTSGALSGSTSLSLASSGATTAGDMLVSNAFTVDPAGQASVLAFSFYYQISSGAANGNFSGTSSNSYGIAIYDATNNAWVQPAGVFNVVAASATTAITARATGTFQLPITCTSARIAIFFPNASSGAITMLVDDVFVGPQVTPQAPAISDWQAYTPVTQGFGTISNVAVYWRRVGSDVQVRGSWTNGTTTATQAQIGLPSGLTSLSDTSSLIIGTYARASSTASHGGLILKTNGATYVNMGPADTFGSTANTSLTAANGNATSGTETISFEFFCPITGWSSNSVSSADTDTRVLAARIYKTSNQGPFSVETKLTGYTVDYDNAAMWDSTNNRFNIPVAGSYQLYVQTNSVAATTATQVAAYKVTGGSTIYIGTDSATNTQSRFGGSAIIPNLKAGDYIEIYQYTGASVTVQAGTQGTFASLTKISGPAVITATDTVAARYLNTSGQTVTQPTVTILNYAVVDYDTTNSVTTGASWKFTAPVSGKYLITGMVTTQNASQVAGNRWIGAIYKNGSYNQTAGLRRFDATLTASLDFNFVGTISLLAGDYIDFRIDPNVTASLSTTSGNNWIAIERIGN